MKLAQEVLELIKSLVGRETFSRAYASLQQTATEARETRKRKAALEVSPECEKRSVCKPYDPVLSPHFYMTVFVFNLSRV